MTSDADGNASHPAFSSEDGVGKKSQAGISRPVSKTASTNITLAELIAHVNEKDGGLLKYIPDAFLTESQQKAKARALAEQEEYDKVRNKNMEVSKLEIQAMAIMLKMTKAQVKLSC